jgi:glycosyltransferase involved in cell wall biosynthesis
MIDDITPILLTFNEARNLRRTLSCLSWAKDIVIVDSGSNDDTLAIVKEFPQTRLFHRQFDTHCNQWQFAIEQTGIETPWILRLDADYTLTPEFISELKELDLVSVNAYRISFLYAIYSRPLRASLYPANTVLLRRGHFVVWDNGHTERWKVTGPVGTMRARIVHDDWKSMDHWLISQAKYMRRELRKMNDKPEGFRDWLRLHPPLMPLTAFFYCLFVKRLILGGKSGIFYALQRTMAEMILSLMLLEDWLNTGEARNDRGYLRP